MCPSLRVIDTAPTPSDKMTSILIVIRSSNQPDVQIKSYIPGVTVCEGEVGSYAYRMSSCATLEAKDEWKNFVSNPEEIEFPS